MKLSMLIAACFFLALSCKKDPVQPPPNGGPDTTSHNFQWQIDTIAEGNSFLRDVAVIDENNVWVVGTMFLRDSLGAISDTAHNVTQWDGSRWIFRRLFFPKYNTDCTIAFYLASPITAVFAVSTNNILVSDGGSIARWNGSVFIHYPCLSHSLRNGPIVRIWGRSDDDFFVAGANGTLLRFHNGTWQRLESGTTLDVVDIWGSRDQTTGDWEVLAVASRSFAGPERVLLQIPIDGGPVTMMSDSGITRALESVWFVSRETYYTVGDGVYHKQSVATTEPWSALHGSLTTFYSRAVRGSSKNNVIIAGAFGDILHYNGSTWKQYHELQSFGSFYRVAVNGSIVGVVGYRGNSQVVLRGKHN